eukprot:4119678-Alexandrium_andersonii.AAC.1
MMLQCCSSMSRLPAWLSRWPTLALPLGYILEPETLRPVYEVLAWSFNVLATGRMPSSDHAGRPFKAMSKRERASGSVICAGYFPVL